MNIKIKKLTENAVIPKYAKPGDAAVDLVATSKEYTQASVMFGTGLAVEIPEGHVGLVFPRSSIYKTPFMLSNSVGVIDSGYRGEIKVIFKILDRPIKNYEVGDRVAQLMILPIPTINYTETNELSQTERNDGGFGSTGA